MELNVTISVLVLLPVALALLGGGLVLYRRSTREGWQATGLGSVALGVGVLLVFTVTLPVFHSSEGESPEPAVSAALMPVASNGATGPDSDEVPTPAPPTEIHLTQVIEMARSGHLQSIEVSGDKLEVTTLNGVTFASRKVEGTSIGELLDRAGVDHIASGLQITVKGSAARERGSSPVGQTAVTATPTATPTNDEVSTPAAHGSPPPPPLSGSPLPTLVFGGVRYTHGGSYEAPVGEATTFVIDGIEVHVADLEVEGTTTEGNTHGITDGLQVYRSQTGDTRAVYTFMAGQDRVNPEDGQIFKGRDTWTLWVPMAG